MLEDSPSIHFSTAWRQNSAIISFRWGVPSWCPPLSPGPAKYSDFVGFSKHVVFTYKVVLFCILKFQCFQVKFCESSSIRRSPGWRPAAGPTGLGGRACLRPGTRSPWRLAPWGGGFVVSGKSLPVDCTLPWPSCYRGLLLNGKGGRSELGDDPYTFSNSQ